MDDYIPNDYGPPEIEPEEIEYNDNEILGSGAYGNVYAGKCRAQEVAVKVLSNQQFSESEIETFRKEINVMSKINHPNIVLYMGACTVDGELKIVTEKMKTDLSTLLHSDPKPMSLIQKMRLAKDCAMGMSWLHGSQNGLIIIHHDLKPSNCLIDENMKVKISDFGFSIIKPKGEFICSEVPRGTALYMAPEIYFGEQYDEKCDVYSFGIILWEIYTRIKPYENIPDLSTDTFFDNILNIKLRPIIPEDCPAKIKSLITKCWDADPKVRPSFSNIVDRLQEIILEEAIIDPAGRSFWEKNFWQKNRDKVGTMKEKVSWNQFIREFVFMMGKAQNDLLLIECIKELLVVKQNDDEIVSLDQFGKILDFFGPIRGKDGLKNQFFDNLKRIFSKAWFHGNISIEEAGGVLYKTNPGTFLVRFSSSERGYFTISLSNGDVGKCINVKIKHPPLKDEFSTPQTMTKRSSLIEFIEKEADILNLKEPCSGSKFAYILSKPVSEYI
jgi:serine/threonine protein kinase